MKSFEHPLSRLQADDLDPRSAVACAEELVRRRRAAEADELKLVAAWAGLHSSEPVVPESEPARRFGDRLVQVGGDGTPKVQEFSLAELAVARQQHVVGCRQVMADTLDLLHRLPRCWQRVQDLACDAWVARRIARLTHHLSLSAVGLVDGAVAAVLGTESPGRVLTVVEAKIIEADPDTYAARIAAEAQRRVVHVSRSNDAGLRTIFARVEAGDATWVDAMVDRVARILQSQGRPGNLDELRAEAFGWLARPAEVVRLLLEHDQAAPDSEDEPVGPEEEPAEPWPSRSTAFPADLLQRLSSIDPAKLRPPGVLHVHVQENVLEGRVDGVARCEGLGPFLPEQLRELLGGTQVRVEPVVDLAEKVSLNCYEHPEWLKNRVFQISGGDYFPYAVSVARNLDVDHVAPYVPDGPPGQTGTHNSGPLNRFYRRVKTHAKGWAVRQPEPGIYVWRSPHNMYRLVDHRGTRSLSAEQGARYFGDAEAS